MDGESGEQIKDRVIRVARGDSRVERLVWGCWKETGSSFKELYRRPYMPLGFPYVDDVNFLALMFGWWFWFFHYFPHWSKQVSAVANKSARRNRAVDSLTITVINYSGRLSEFGGIQRYLLRVFRHLYNLNGLSRTLYAVIVLFLG